MKQKCKCPPAGAPEWMATFSDMMSLLLCFFVLIVAFSEIKKEDQYQAVVEEIKKAFGMRGGGGTIEITDDPEMSMIEKLIATALYRYKEPTYSEVRDPGVQGQHEAVESVRPGELQVVGVPVTFEPGSAELTPTAQQQLLQVAGQLRGHNNLIDIRGHAETVELEQRESPYPDLWTLSHARSRAVADFLASPTCMVEPERMRLVACADFERLKQRATTLEEQARNRRVEVMQSQATVANMRQPE